MSVCHASLIMFVLLSKVKDFMQENGMFIVWLSFFISVYSVYINFSMVLKLGPCQLCTAVQDRGAWPTFRSVPEPSLLNFQYKYMIYPCNADCCTQLKRVNFNTVEIFYILPPHHGATATSGPGLLVTEASWSHSDTPHLVGLLWTSDRPPDAETSTWQHTSFTEDKHPCPQWDLNLQFQQVSDCRPTPRTAWLLGLYCPKHTVFLNTLTLLRRTNIMRLAWQPDVCTSITVLAWTTVIISP